MVKLFNFEWVNWAVKNDVPVVMDMPNVIGEAEHFPAIILYPSLLTPEIVVDDEKIEFLILAKNKELNAFTINRHLKICSKFGPDKSFVNELLFDDSRLTDNTSISFKIIGELEEKRPYDIGRFCGILDERIVGLFKNEKFKYLYEVIISNDCLKYSIKYNKPQKIRAVDVMQDKIIDDVLEEMNSKEILEGGKYCSKIFNNGADLLGFDKGNPIQSYHPVFYYQDVEYFNFVFFSDIHISPVQQILSKSKARVVEYKVNGKEEDLDVSPEIGPLVNNCAKDFINLLRQVKEEDIILIGGDIVDYIKGCWRGLNPFIKKQSDIWKAVEISENSIHYTDFSSHIAFYSLIMDFYKTHKNPIFIVNGNHDCYWEPYGISPRVVSKRANEGIPADHNLTFNEAILIFGPSYDEISESFNFDKSLLKWFYSIYTPFKDYSVEFPKQIVIGLGWGDSEDIVGTIGDTKGAPFGSQDWWAHLPRSDDAISKEQKYLLENAENRNKKIIVFSHFTVVSFKSKIREDTLESFRSKMQKNITLAKINVQDNYGGDYDEGCFESNRDWFFNLLTQGMTSIKCIMTGHSHRRGIYTITGLPHRRVIINRLGSYTIINEKEYFATSLALENWSSFKDRPLIIVSDSAGPLPRMNLFGEFLGWGSDSPGGTKVVFDGNGDVGRIEFIKVGIKPRIPVAIDYLIHLEGKIKINTDFISKDDPIEPRLIFNFSFRQIRNLDEELFWTTIMNFELLTIKKVILYSFDENGKKWEKIESGEIEVYPRDIQYVSIFKEKVKFSDFFKKRDEKKIKFFIAVQFAIKEEYAKYFNYYNTNKDYWVCAIDIEKETIGFGHIYHIKPKEIPDFEFYKKAFPDKY